MSISDCEDYVNWLLLIWSAIIAHKKQSQTDKHWKWSKIFKKKTAIEADVGFCWFGWEQSVERQIVANLPISQVSGHGE